MGLKIIMGVCFIPFVFIMFGFLYFEGMKSGNIQFGVTLWPQIEQDERYQKIKKSFGKEMRWLLLICLSLFALTSPSEGLKLSLPTSQQHGIFLLYLLFFFQS